MAATALDLPIQWKTPMTNAVEERVSTLLAIWRQMLNRAVEAKYEGRDEAATALQAEADFLFATAKRYQRELDAAAA